MRIANNIMAMNTHRQYAINNDRVQASAEKLSSGYRINRAADDAAGLAISEKMRSQIRGLNMAAKNSQDAVSLIQTAEGALQEVHSMLQRMNELAVQSATGTNEGFDRTQIAKEFEQLKREVNDISEQTTFNNMKLLDGSLSAKGLQRTKYTSGVYTNFEKMDPETNVGGLKKVTTTPGQAYFAATPAQFTVDLTGISAATELTAGANKEVLKIDGKAVALSTDAAINVGYTTNAAAADVAKAFKDATITLGSNDFKVTSIDGAKVTFTAQVPVSAVSAETVAGYTVAAGTYTEVAASTLAGKVTDAVGGGADKQGTVATSSFQFVYAEAHSGDAFTIGDKTYVFYNSTTDDKNTIERLKKEASTDANDRFALDLANITTATALAKAINLAQSTPAISGDATTPAKDVNSVEAKASGDVITLTYIGTAGSTTATTNNATGGKDGVEGNYGVRGTHFVSVDSKPLNDYTKGTTTFEIDVAKLKVGDKLVYQTKSATGVVTDIDYTHEEGNDISDILARFSIKEDAAKGITVDGNSWTETGVGDQGSRLTFIAAEDYKAGTYEPMKIQVGALEGEQLSIKIAAMNTAGLGLDTSSIYTQDDAGKAVTATRAAINTVSDQRALLGAMQNRMTHKIANLKVSVENLQASESRIRDIDIASEMTTFTKNNILSQAATSMLAQANSAPQNVLSLLK